MKIEMNLDENMSEFEKQSKNIGVALALLLVTLSLKFGGPEKIWFINNPQGTYGGYFLSIISISTIVIIFSAARLYSLTSFQIKLPEINLTSIFSSSTPEIHIPAKYRSELDSDALEDIENGNCPSCGAEISESNVDWAEGKVECDTCES